MSDGSVALVTPSYAGDFERCRLLCDSMDAHVSGHTRHLILVEDADAELFSVLAGPRREIVRETDILDASLHPVTLAGRRLWLSFRVPPLRGWHVQQLRRIAVAHHADEAAFLYCDSDMAFARPFDVGALWRGGELRLYRNDQGITVELAEKELDHLVWTRRAHAMLGLPGPRFPAHDYINNLVSWRRESVLAMCARIEEVVGIPWWRAIARRRLFSECQIYGAFADGVRGGAGHWTTGHPLCLTRWFGEALDEGEMRDLLDTMAPDQVALGIQSFTGSDPTLLRRALGLQIPNRPLSG